MKRKLLILCTVLVTLASFAAVTGCVRSDDDVYYDTYGDVTFWNDQTSVGFIDVTVDNQYTATIRSTQEAFNCNYTGSANFYLRSGYHTYYAEATTGQTWRGDFTINGSCLLFELYR